MAFLTLVELIPSIMACISMRISGVHGQSTQREAPVCRLLGAMNMWRRCNNEHKYR